MPVSNSSKKGNDVIAPVAVEASIRPTFVQTSQLALMLSSQPNSLCYSRSPFGYIEEGKMVPKKQQNCLPNFYSTVDILYTCFSYLEDGNDMHDIDF